MTLKLLGRGFPTHPVRIKRNRRTNGLTPGSDEVATLPQSNLRAPAPGGAPGGPSLYPQAHGGALMRGGTPESLSKGGRVAAECDFARSSRR